MRRLARTDANHQRIMDALRTLGADVVSTHQVGGGFPDLLVNLQGYVHLVEVKDKGGRLTPAQESFHRRFPVKVLESEIDCVRWVNELRKAGL